jgi:hypothetical protein
MTMRPYVIQAAHSEDESTLEPAMISGEAGQETVRDLFPQRELPKETAAMPPKTERLAQQAALQPIQTPNLSDVYEQAGVRVPAHGFSILKIAEMLSNGHIRDLAPEAKGAAVLMALEASNVKLKDVIEDAAVRERVLNEYEAQQQQMFQNYKAGKQQQNQEAQAEIERLMEQLRLRIQTNEKELTSEKARLDEWRAKKREEERRIRTATSHFGVGQQAGTEGALGSAAAQRQPLQSEAPASAGKKLGDASDRSSATSPAADNGGGRPGATRPSLWKR